MDLENRLNAELDGLLIAEKELMKAQRALDRAQNAYDKVAKKIAAQRKNIEHTEKWLLAQINGKRKINSVYSDYHLKRKALGLDN